MAKAADDALELIYELDEDGMLIIIIIFAWLMSNIKRDGFLIHIHQHFPNIVKTLLTEQAEPSVIERTKEQANLLDYLHKPWSEEELVRTIKSGLTQL